MVHNSEFILTQNMCQGIKANMIIQSYLDYERNMKYYRWGISLEQIRYKFNTRLYTFDIDSKGGLQEKCHSC